MASIGLSRAAHAALLLFALLLPACTGSGQIELASLNYQSIDPPAPRVTRLAMDHCFWWTDERGQVWVAMERSVPSILGEKFRFDFQITLVFEKLPAGKARNYTVRDRQLRAVARAGPVESRFSSLLGIAAIYRQGDRLRGSVRMEVGQQSNSLLSGWTRPSRQLLLGTFEAVPDEQRGRAILSKTDADGFEREEKPVTTRPATTVRSESAQRGE